MSTATATSPAPIDNNPRRDKPASARPLFDPPIVKRAALEAFGKLDPRRMIKDPVMFVVEIGSVFTTILFLHALATSAGDASAWFMAAVSVWLWFTVLFANFAEAMAEGRGTAQAGALRKARKDVPAIEAHTSGRTFGILGEPRVDVVALNARTRPPRP